MAQPAKNGGDASDDDIVPVFGTWRVIYTCVVVWTLIVMGLIALFSTWPY